MAELALLHIFAGRNNTLVTNVEVKGGALCGVIIVTFLPVRLFQMRLLCLMRLHIIIYKYNLKAHGSRPISAVCYCFFFLSV